MMDDVNDTKRAHEGIMDEAEAVADLSSASGAPAPDSGVESAGGPQDKTALRKQLLARRRALSPAKRAGDSLLLGQNVAAFLDARCVPAQSTVAVYQAMSDEANLAALIALLYAEGATVAFPCTRSAESMDFYALSARELDGDVPAFIEYPGRFFPDEPFDDLTLVPPSDIDVMIVPGVAFDKEKTRMGMGAGCYDRYLPKLADTCIVIGVAFDEQLVEVLPRQEFDRPVDYVITPTLAF